MTTRGILVAGALALLLVGCANTVDHQEWLDRNLRAYAKAIRWADFDTAYAFRKDDGTTPPVLPPHLKQVRVTAYDSGGVRLTPDGKRATQRVSIRYYRADMAVERSIEDLQEWEQQPDGKRWLLLTPIPDFN